MRLAAEMYVKSQIRLLDQFRMQAVAMQYKTLSDLLKSNTQVEYLKTFALKKLTYSEFSSKVPIVNYEALKPFIFRMLKGEQKLLCTEDVHFFAKSSGTTDVSKYLPLTLSGIYRGHFLASRHLLASYFERFPKNQIFSGKHFSISGSMQPWPDNPKVNTGDISALLTYNIPKWIQLLRSPRLEVALMKNWDEKIQAIITQIHRENITGMSGAPSWLLEILKNLRDKYCQNGVYELWENFELLIYGGMHFKPYQSSIERMIGRKINYINAYN
ncbi:MAG: GH3 auxin-responsive promoter family protein, partial [Chitinophagales bacterium]|nr:GH3 auxin-responsive promoter family protein [Chitinophagales bacterium]